MSMKLSPRDQHIFNAVMHAYCDGAGQPVASTRLAKQKGMAVCSATVRNAMARLEKQGLLYSPHTSAGRVPTNTGLSYWLEAFFQLPDIANYWQPEQSELVELAHGLSRRYRLCCCVGLPQATTVEVFRVEVLDFDRKHWLILLIDCHGQSHNILILKPLEANDTIRYQFATWLNSVFSQQSLMEGLHRMRAMSNTAPMFCHGSLAQWTRELSNKLGSDNSIVVGENYLYAHSKSEHQYQLGVNFLHYIEDKFAFKNGVSVIAGQDLPFAGFENLLVLSVPYFVNQQYQSRFCIICAKSAEIAAIIQELSAIKISDS